MQQEKNRIKFNNFNVTSVLNNFPKKFILKSTLTYFMKNFTKYQIHMLYFNLIHEVIK